MIDLKMSKKQSTELHAVDSFGGEKFPHGMQISLDNDTLKKLNFDELPAVGTEMIIVGLGTVTSASENRNHSGVNRHVSIQIEAVEVEPASKSTKSKTASDAVSEAIKDV